MPRGEQYGGAESNAQGGRDEEGMGAARGSLELWASRTRPCRGCTASPRYNRGKWQEGTASAAPGTRMTALVTERVCGVFSQPLLRCQRRDRH